MCCFKVCSRLTGLAATPIRVAHTHNATRFPLLLLFLLLLLLVVCTVCCASPTPVSAVC